MAKRPTHLQIEQTPDRLVATVQLEELLYSIDVEVVHRELEQRLAKSPNCTLIIDMQQVMAVSSEWIGAVLMLQRQAREIGSRIRLCCLDERVLHTFKLSRVDSALSLFDSLEEAISG